MKFPYTGVILAGGLNKRFSGKNKAFIRLGEKRILDRIYSVFNDLFEEIILVTNDPLEYFEWDLTIVTDLFPKRSSLTGIHAGLFYAKNPYAFVAACDTPFLNRDVIEMVLDGLDPHIDVVIPETSKGLEPLCSLYAIECLKPLEQQLAKDEFKIDRFLQKIRVKKIPETMLRKKDPHLISFFNINTPEDLKQAQEIEHRL
ncbi:MAG: molybdenum cofactor guanylyltransferase [Pseudomonadota bacterium]